MKSFIVFALVLATALAAPQTRDGDAEIVKYESDNIGVDGYKYEIETSNGIKQKEFGELKNAGTENEAIDVIGEFSYIGPDNNVYSVQYTAGVNGFEARGTHIPQK